MKLKDIPAGTKVFIDANIFLYLALNDRRYLEPCRRFLKRVESGEIHGYTSTLVLNEVLHQMMRMEIALARQISLADAAHYLKSNPNAIKGLKVTWKGIKRIQSMPNLFTCDVTAPSFWKGVENAEKYGLLATDGLHLAIMEAHGLTHLASNDSDFKRVSWVRLYQP